MSTVKVIRNYDSEMIEVHINGELNRVGNFWDFDADDWIDIMQKAGVTVEEETANDE